MTWLRLTWCRLMHTRASWPINGKYHCPRCQMEHACQIEMPAVIASRTAKGGSNA